MVKIAELVRVREFAPVIELDMADQPLLYRQLVGQYIVTEDLADLFARILNSPLTASGAVMSEVLNRRSHLITAQYGSGKTYFLLMLASMLESLGDPERLAATQAKFSDFSSVLKALRELKGKKFLVIRLNAKGHGDVSLRELLVRSLRDAATAIKPDLVLESEYSAASENLHRLKGSGAGQLFEQELQKAEGIGLDHLRDGLLDLHHGSLVTYRGVYERVFKTSAPHTGLDLAKSFSSTLEQLKDKGYTNIVILVDEMTQYLQSSAHYFPLIDTLGVLEDFAEFCNIGNNRCMLVAAMHRSLRRILQERGIDPDQEEDWRKFIGRFDDHDIQFSDYERMLERVFDISPQFDQYTQTPVVRQQVANLQVTARQYLGLERSTPVPRSAYFPLHPATLHYLRGVSDRLGQEKRTAFSFIKDHVKSALAREDLLVDERLNILGPDELFDYFLPDLEQHDEVGIIYTYNAAKARLLEDRLALRIFKALAMQYCSHTTLSSQGPAVIEQGMTIPVLADILNVTDQARLKTSLDLMLAMRPQVVFYDHDTDQYWFVPGAGEWDIDREIAKIIEQLDPLDELRKELKRLGERIELNQPSAIDVIVSRDIECEWQSVAWFKKQTKIAKRKDAKFVFVIPEFVESYDRPSVDLGNKAKELARGGVCIILPQSSAMLAPQDLKEVAALRKLESHDKVTSSAQYMRIVRTRLTNAAARVEQALVQFGSPSNLLFYIESTQEPVQDFEEAARRLFGALYPKFPRVQMERISGRSVTNKVINTLIATKARNIPDTDQSEDARFVRDALPAMGLGTLTLTAGGKMAILTMPQPGGEGHDIWDTMDKALRENRSFDQFNTALGSSPYGLPDYMREVYLAAYLAFKRVAIRNIKENRFETTVTADLVKDIVSKGRKAYDIHPVTGDLDALRPFALDVWRLVEEAQGQRNYANIKIEIQGDQAVWYNSIRPALRNYAGGRLSLVLAAVSEVNDALEPFVQRGKGQIQTGYLQDFRDGLQSLAASHDYLTAGSGYQRLLELCQSLPGDVLVEGGEVMPDQAYYRLKELDVAWQDLVEDEQANGHAVAKCIRTITEIRSLAENVVSEQHTTAGRAAAQALQQCIADIFDHQGRKTLVDSVTRLWQGYVKAHVTEHDIIVDLRTSFGKSLLDSTEYALLRSLSRLEFGLLKPTVLSASVDKVRGQACSRLGEIPDFPQTQCPKCKQFYLTGSGQRLNEELKKQEDQLRESLDGALRGYLWAIRRTGEKDKFSEYLGKQGEKEQQAWQQFMALDLSVIELDSRQILDLAPMLVAIVTDFEKHLRTPPVVRVPVDTLVKSLEGFLSSNGVSEPSHSELAEMVQRWLSQVRHSHYK